MDQFFHSAIEHVRNAYVSWNDGNYLLSYLKCVPARLCFLADLVMSVTKSFFSLIKLTFLSLKNLFVKKEHEKIQDVKDYFTKYTSRIFLSAVGAWGVPSFSYLFRNTDFFRERFLCEKLCNYAVSLLTCRKIQII